MTDDIRAKIMQSADASSKQLRVGNPGAGRSVKPDNFTLSYVVWLGLYFSPFIAALSIPVFLGGLDAVLVALVVFYPLLFLAYLLGMLAFLVARFVRHWRNRQWRRALSVIFSPFILVVVVALVLVFHVPNWVYFQLHKSSYIAEISRIPREGGNSRAKMFVVGGYGIVTSSTTEAILYDESDAIGTSYKADDCTAFRRIEAHFYYVTMNDQCSNFWM
ncbi:MAG: hypothetical protein HYX36_14060 [Rhizobiales bacterium]|nr:hypothetical protein [Hyphomicrobiales bacterium]